MVSRHLVLLLSAVAAGCSCSTPHTSSKDAPASTSATTARDSERFVAQIEARTWLPEALRSRLISGAIAAIDAEPGASSRLSPDKLARGPAQLGRWLDANLKRFADRIRTDEDVRAAADMTMHCVQVFVALPTVTPAQREEAVRRWVEMMELVPAFVDETFTDTPADVRSRIADTAVATLRNQSIELDDYFDAEHLVLKPFAVRRETLFSIAHQPRHLLSGDVVSYQGLARRLEDPELPDESREFFIKDFVDRMADRVSSTWRRTFHEQTSDRAWFQPWTVRLQPIHKSYREMVGRFEIQEAQERENAKPRGTNDILRKTNTASPAGVPTPPK